MNDEKRDEVLTMENELLRGLIEAAEDRENEIVTIEVERKGKVYFTFRIRPITEKESNRASDLATKYKRVRGVKIPEDVDTAKYRSLLVHAATVEEDRKKIWDNKTLWEKWNLASGIDMIDKILHPGEKAAVIEKINEISGYSDDPDEDLDELAKN